MLCHKSIKFFEPVHAVLVYIWQQLRHACTYTVLQEASLFAHTKNESRIEGSDQIMYAQACLSCNLDLNPHLIV